MEPVWKNALWQQFGAAIDMLENSIRSCPESLWEQSMWNNSETPPGFSAFWYVAYHALFWLDLYLTGSLDGFAPPPPFTLTELDPAGILPERVYTRFELLGYLALLRRKCQMSVETLTDERLNQPCHFAWGVMPYAGLLLDNMRHVQEHGAQLHMFLGQQAVPGSRWITKLKED